MKVVSFLMMAAVIVVALSGVSARGEVTDLSSQISNPSFETDVPNGTIPPPGWGGSLAVWQDGRASDGVRLVSGDVDKGIDQFPATPILEANTVYRFSFEIQDSSPAEARQAVGTAYFYAVTPAGGWNPSAFNRAQAFDATDSAVWVPVKIDMSTREAAVLPYVGGGVGLQIACANVAGNYPIIDNVRLYKIAPGNAVFSHDIDVNPELEGWQLTGNAAGEGPAVYEGEACWYVTDTDGSALYRRYGTFGGDLTAEHVGGWGWELEARLAAGNLKTVASDEAALMMGDGSRVMELCLYANSGSEGGTASVYDRQTSTVLKTDIPTLAGSGGRNIGWHTLKVAYRSSSGKYAVHWDDNLLAESATLGAVSGYRGIYFGGMGGTGFDPRDVTSYWNRITFTQTTPKGTVVVLR